jgi:hypothetical protein
MYIFFIALVMVSPVRAGAGWLVYEEGTAVKSINGEDPVGATSRVYIATDPQTVWHVMTDFTACQNGMRTYPGHPLKERLSRALSSYGRPVQGKSGPHFNMWRDRGLLCGKEKQ